ncbi:ParB/RepB/Spo0J family partition protein [Streptomyces sp. cmx-4-9]|uniref:ParB/RepB/Spo0J family partition protein n=1 Tax=Streptomyces sp. cmx-4-9 TaxID=2790941 RepID=UPI003980FB29
MSKADKLGGGASFQRASALQVGSALSDRGRAKAVAEGRIPSYALVRIPLAKVSSTPLNPRRNFGTPEELTRFGEELRQAQLAACVVVTRQAYLAIWPDHAPQIGDAEYVLVNGERRFRSAQHVELPALDFVIRDEFAESREDFLNRLLKENLDREDFDPVERATGVQQLVEVCAETDAYGAQSRAAEQLKKSRGWVTNQLSLLTLPSEVQASVSAGETSGRDAVWMARRLKDSETLLSAADLFRLLEAHKAEAAQLKAAKRALLDAAGPQLLTAVDNSDGTSGAPAADTGGSPSQITAPVAAPKLLTAVNNQEDIEAGADSPSPVVEQGSGLLTAVDNSDGTSGAPAADTGGSPSQTAAPVAAPKLLTAVNNTDSLPAATVPRPTGEADLGLRQRLGATAAEQADNISRVLTRAELEALVEELCNRI